MARLLEPGGLGLLSSIPSAPANATPLQGHACSDRPGAAKDARPRAAPQSERGTSDRRRGPRGHGLPAWKSQRSSRAYRSPRAGPNVTRPGAQRQGEQERLRAALRSGRPPREVAQARAGHWLLEAGAADVARSSTPSSSIACKRCDTRRLQPSASLSSAPIRAPETISSAPAAIAGYRQRRRCKVLDSQIQAGLGSAPSAANGSDRR